MAFKDLIFKKEEKPTKKAEPSHSTAMPINIGGAMPVMTATPVNGVDYAKHLEDVLRKNNQAGLDYLEFADAISSPALQMMTEQNRYVATFPSYLAMGISAAKLVDSAKSYLILLQKEMNDFRSELERSKNVGITQKNQQIEKIKGEIEQLTQQIQAKTGMIQRLSGEVNEANSTLALADNNFNLAYNNRVGIINDHITKIQNYLNNDTTTK